MKRALTIVTISVAAILTSTPTHADQDKVTICHYTGLAGTEHNVTLTLPVKAVFGKAGHFNESGTPAAGHENDRLGPCQPETTSTSTSSTTSTSTTTTPPSTVAPTTSVADSTTSSSVAATTTKPPITSTSSTAPSSTNTGPTTSTPTTVTDSTLADTGLNADTALQVVYVGAALILAGAALLAARRRRV